MQILYSIAFCLAISITVHRTSHRCFEHCIYNNGSNREEKGKMNNCQLYFKSRDLILTQTDCVQNSGLQF